ncbi:MAG: carboxypeptidase regulatory-like domain-containing protein [Thermoplasmatota archaeon]
MWYRGVGEKGHEAPARNFLIFLILISLLFPAGIAGGKTRISATVRGTVTGQGGTPLENVEISVSKIGDNWYDGAFTNETGYYYLTLHGNGDYRIEFLKEGYLNHIEQFTVVDYNSKELDPDITTRPPESETLTIELYSKSGSLLDGKKVTATYQRGNDRYQYSDLTQQDGRVTWDVFPAEYKVEVTDSDLIVVEEEIEVEQGIGNYNLKLDLYWLPPKDCRIIGYVTNSTGAMEDAMVAVRDNYREVTNHTLTDVEGYYELGFWEGRHFLFSMAEGHDAYFHSLELGPGDTVWMNITLKEEKYHITGTVSDQEGLPVENITVQLFTRNGFPEDNSDTTNPKGEFDFWTGEGTGYLIVADDPFEAGRYDTHFQELNISSDMELDIDLTDNDIFTMRMYLHFRNWSYFRSISRFRLPENNTMVIKAMIDLMVGDGDLFVTTQEVDAWYDLLTGQDNEIEKGPFGANSGDDLTVDERSYGLVDGKADVTFSSFLGRVRDPVNGTIRVDANYSCGPFEDPFTSHTIRSNISYRKEKEDACMRVFHPHPAFFQEPEETLHEIAYPDTYPPYVEIFPALDPDEEDDVDSEWVEIGFHNTLLEVDLGENHRTGYVGEEQTFMVNITEDALPDNKYRYDWNIFHVDQNDTLMDNMTITGEPYLNYIFNRTGSYKVEVLVTDKVGRERRISQNIMIRVPEPKIETEGGWNQTFYEGQVIEVSANLSYEPECEMFMIWAKGDIYKSSENPDILLTGELNWTEENSTQMITLDHSGRYQIEIRIWALGLQGGRTNRTMDVFFWVENLPPTSCDHRILENGLEGDLDVVQGENITIELYNITDPSDEFFYFEWILPDGIWESYSLPNYLDPGKADKDHLVIQFWDPGNYTIRINITDPDDGWLIKELEFNVSENYTFDLDGDGLPNWYEDQFNFSSNDPADAMMDHDNDGWSNLQEFKNLTDPRNNDTDGDGVPDPWDENPRDENILGFDSDDDGFSDWEEMKAGTDPNDPEDHPGEKEGGDAKNDGDWIWISLASAGLMILIGGVVYILAKKNQSMMEHEE